MQTVLVKIAIKTALFMVLQICLMADLDLLQLLSSEEGDSPFMYVANASIRQIGVIRYSEDSLACRVHVLTNSLVGFIM